MEVSGEEIELLNMHSKYQVNNTLRLEDFVVDLAIMGCKYRWKITREEQERLEEANITDDERVQGEEEAARSRQTFNSLTKTVNLNKRRFTDIRETKR